MNTASQRSGELFDSGWYCAESVLLAIAEHHNIQSEWIPQIATGFCSGMARTCGVCGAVSGAMMGIGLASGRRSPQESVEKTYAYIRKFLAAFEQTFGSTNCRVLTGCDLNTEEGQRYFDAKNICQTCKRYTEEATRIAMIVIEEQ